MKTKLRDAALLGLGVTLVGGYSLLAAGTLTYLVLTEREKNLECLRQLSHVS